MERILSRVLRTFGYVAALTVLMASPAHANDSSYIDTIAAQVADDSVYVEEGVAYATATTEASLASRLTSSDHIVLVALNDGASATIDNPEVFVQKLGEALDSEDTKIVLGLSIGDETYVYSDYIPTLANTELMHKAETVSTNPAEVLGTYVANVHKWQVNNPEPVEPIVANSDPSFPIIGVLVFIVGAVGGLITFRILRRNRVYEQVRIGVIKRPARAQVIRLLELRLKVHDTDLRRQLGQIAKDIEYYFKQRGRHTQAITAQLANDLNRVNTVLDGYIKTQGNRRYYSSYDEIVAMTERSVETVARQTLNLVQQGSYEGLEKFLGAAEILQLNDPSSLFD